MWNIHLTIHTKNENGGDITGEITTLCKQVAASLQNLEHVVFTIVISAEEVEQIVRNPAEQEWVEAFKHIQSKTLFLDLAPVTRYTWKLARNGANFTHRKYYDAEFTWYGGTSFMEILHIFRILIDPDCNFKYGWTDDEAEYQAFLTQFEEPETRIKELFEGEDEWAQ